MKLQTIPVRLPRAAKGLAALAMILLALCQPRAKAQTEWLDKLDDALYLQTPNGYLRSDLSGLLDLEGYHFDGNPPGMLFGERDNYLNPRLSLYLDTKIGSHLYSLLQVRFDRGFDPGARDGGDARFDEYLLRYTPFDDARLNIQAGKFATAFGAWVGRHDSWNNPFINAPLPYENIVIIADQTPPPSLAAFLARRAKPDQKRSWMPMIWGPSYATGASVFGVAHGFAYALEVKNAGLSSRPSSWDATTVGFENPTVTGRLGVKPNATWDVGASASYGPYYAPTAQTFLPRGTSLGDFNQLTVGPDVTFAWRHWQVWGEAFASRFEVPMVGNVETVAYFLESKYKLTPRLFVAARWNQQMFDKILAPNGQWERWDRDIWRAEAALGYRFDRHLQGKIQYGHSLQNGPIQQGNNTVAAQLTVKF